MDLEDWFHATVTGAPAETDWDRLESRIESQTSKLLNLLDKCGARATFFVLGWVAEKHPSLVVEISARGHEIGTHGYKHDLLSSFTAETFGRDIDLALEAIESTGVNKRVVGYRAPSYSLTAETSWAWGVLADKGFRYDASVFPQRRHDGGWPGAPSRPYRPLDGRDFWEVPVSLGRIGPFKTVFSAGGYLRLFPTKTIVTNLKRLESAGVPVVFMVHPKDVDPAAPVTTRNVYGILRQKLRTGSTLTKLKTVLRCFSFTTMLDAIEEAERKG